MASSSYHQFKIADGQMKNLQTAIATKTPVTLRLKPEQKLVQAMTLQKAVTYYLVAKGMVRGGGLAQYGGFLGMLASKVPFAIDLVSKRFGKGMQVRPPIRRRRSLLPPPKEKGMYIRAPHFFGSWNDYLKKNP